MATALNRLLLEISDTIPADKFKKLIGLYDIDVPDINNQFEALKHLKKNDVLDLEEFVKNLVAVQCSAESDKIAKYIRETEGRQVYPQGVNVRAERESSSSFIDVGQSGSRASTVEPTESVFNTEGMKQPILETGGLDPGEESTDNPPLQEMESGLTHTAISVYVV